jgi:antitoxin component YwqK of YwqJK toxin-antitoxin module
MIAMLGVISWILLRRPPAARESTVVVTPRASLLHYQGRWCQLPKTNTFSGAMVEYYPDGSLLSRSEVRDGVLQGLTEGWYSKGQLQIQEHYTANVADGLREKWYENGCKKSEAMIVNGKLEGTFRSWHDNGQLAEQIQMKQGHPDGEASAFYPSGFVKTQMLVSAGKVLSQQSWQDGRHEFVGQFTSASKTNKQ